MNNEIRMDFSELSDKNDTPNLFSPKSWATEFAKETKIKQKICDIFEEDVGIVDDGRGVFAAMVQFIYECMDNEGVKDCDFENGDIKKSVNKAIMKILEMDKEKTGVEPDDFSMICKRISKTFSDSYSDSSLVKENSDEKEICDKINLSFLQ